LFIVLLGLLQGAQETDFLRTAGTIDLIVVFAKRIKRAHELARLRFGGLCGYA
jgi:hypothetical protein